MNRDLARLEAACAAWEGTPYCENSAIKGVGICCNAAFAEAYFEADWLPRSRYPMPNIGKTPPSKAVEFLAPWFDRVATAQPGDLLLCRNGRTSHFLILLSGGRAFHAHARAVVAPNLPTMWAKRVHSVWRPKPLDPRPSTLDPA